MYPTKENEITIKNLVFLTRTYEGLTKTITSAKNRTQSLVPEKNLLHDTVIREMGKVKDRISSKIGKELKFWPIWSEWLEKVPNVGPSTAAKYILFYYYRMTPICPKCGDDLEKTDGTYFCNQCQKSVKGNGNLKYRIDPRDFPENFIMAALSRAAQHPALPGMQKAEPKA